MYRFRNTLALAAVLILVVVSLSADEKKEEQLNTPPEGFTALFNGTDLAGWQSVVTMKERATLTKEQIEKKLEADNEKNLKHWTVSKGVIEYDGKAVDINFNPDYLVDMLKVLPPEADLTLHLIDSASPALFRCGEGYQYLVMPLT